MFEFMDTSQKCTRTLLELKDVVDGPHEDHGYQSEYFTSLHDVYLHEICKTNSLLQLHDIPIQEPHLTKTPSQIVASIETDQIRDNG